MPFDAATQAYIHIEIVVDPNLGDSSGQENQNEDNERSCKCGEPRSQLSTHRVSDF